MSGEIDTLTVKWLTKNQLLLISKVSQIDFFNFNWIGLDWIALDSNKGCFSDS